MNDILDDLIDLQEQATKERTHYYVKSCATRAIDEIRALRTLVKSMGITIDVLRTYRERS